MAGPSPTPSGAGGGDGDSGRGGGGGGLATSTIVYISFGVIVVIITVQVIFITMCLLMCTTSWRHHLISDRSPTPDSPVSFDPNLTNTQSTAVSDGLCGPNHPNVLAPRTISDDIQKIRLLGEGSFGKVYLGK